MTLDRRQRKTKTAVQTALMELMLEKELSKITATDVAERADINRSTFYLHYYDVYAVLEEIKRETADRIIEIAALLNLDNLMSDPYPLLKTVSDELDASPIFQRFLIDNKSDFYAKIETNLIERLTQEYTKLYPDVNRASLSAGISFVTCGSFGAYANWLCSDRTLSLEALCKQLSMLMTYGIQGARLYAPAQKK